jgi:hypothetical protein
MLLHFAGYASQRFIANLPSTRMRFSFVIVAAISGALAGCRASAPPQAVVGEFGTVRAANDESAALAAEYLESLVPRLHAMLPGTEPRAVEVWLQHELEIYRGARFPDHVAGMAEHDHSRIYLRERDIELDLHLAHELVHLLLGRDWDTLPAVLEEGLCDYVAYELAGDSRSTLRAWRLLEAASAFGGLDAVVELRVPSEASRRGRLEQHELRLAANGLPPARPLTLIELSDNEVFEKSTVEVGAGLYGVGYLVVHRIVERSGYHGLHRMCAEAAASGLAQVGTDAILAAAELDPSAETWRRAAMAEITAHDLPELAPLCASTLCDVLLELAGEHYPEHEAVEFLRAARPTLKLTTSRARLPLLASSTIVSRVIERW